MEFWRHDRIVPSQDHHQGTRRDQIDEPAGGVLKDRVERTHGHLVAPSRRDGRLRAGAEVIAVLIGLQREAFAWPPGAGDVAFTAFGGVTDAFLDSQLLKASKLFRTGEPARDLTEIHGANLTDHGLDPKNHGPRLG